MIGAHEHKSQRGKFVIRDYSVNRRCGSAYPYSRTRWDDWSAGEVHAAAWIGSGQK